MDQLKQLTSFVNVVNQGSLSAAARQEGVVAAMIGRRLDALEERLGVKLLVRTTRRVTLTQEGSAFFEECQRILNELNEAEAALASGHSRMRGLLRISASAGFGRRHVAPHIASFQQQHPDVKVTLSLTDRIVDLVAEGIDCAIRISELADSTQVAVRLADNRRVVVASPAYLAQHGIPKTPADLAHHRCLSLGGGSQSRGWIFRIDGRLETLKISGLLECNDGAVLHDWAVAGFGLAWRSLWEVRADLAEGRLVTVLDAYASPEYPIYAVLPQRKFLPERVRRFVDHLKTIYGQANYWP